MPIFILKKQSKRGFTTLFAVLVSSLLLAVGLTIFEITYKEVIFATITRDSNLAFYAADTGLECALFWDLRYNGSANFESGSVFATSTNSTQVPTSDITCNAQDVAASPWTVQTSDTAATTTFTVSFPATPPDASREPCVIVTVAKWGQPSNTSVVARGYNICNPGSTKRIERALQANY